MPILVQSATQASIIVHSQVRCLNPNLLDCKIIWQELLLSFNVQHDCVFSKCKMDSVFIRQEGIITDLTELQVSHCAEQRFILNMHGLHNAHLIREILPRSLTAPTPYLPDRAASHDRFAAELRETGPAKRAETQAKTKATRDRNKQRGIASASALVQRQQDELEHGGDLDIQGIEHTSHVTFSGRSVFT